MTDKGEMIVAVIVAILSSGIIQFFFSRNDKSKEIERKLDRIEGKVDENQAVLARTHILRFSDELKNGIEHSAEYFRQQLDDCDTYERYCEAHPDFKNSYTMVANKHIKETFETLTKEGRI